MTTSPKRTNTMLEIGRMLRKERTMLEEMQKLVNTGALNDNLPSFDLAVNDSLRRIGLLNDSLRQCILSYKQPKRFDPPTPDSAPATNTHPLFGVEDE